jgi:hypothetical protein
MSEAAQPARIARSPAPSAGPEDDDDRVVLRLAREALRSDPPSVRFIGRSGPVSPQGALPWRAFD